MFGEHLAQPQAGTGSDSDEVGLDYGGEAVGEGGGTEVEIMVEAVDPLFNAVVKKDWFRTQVIQIYSVVNPSKLGDVDRLLKKYEGHEQVLCDNICKRYAVDVFQSHDGQWFVSRKYATVSARRRAKTT